MSVDPAALRRIAHQVGAPRDALRFGLLPLLIGLLAWPVVGRVMVVHGQLQALARRLGRGR